MFGMETYVQCNQMDTTGTILYEYSTFSSSRRIETPHFGQPIRKLFQQQLAEDSIKDGSHLISNNVFLVLI